MNNTFEEIDRIASNQKAIDYEQERKRLVFDITIALIAKHGVGASQTTKRDIKTCAYDMADIMLEDE